MYKGNAPPPPPSRMFQDPWVSNRGSHPDEKILIIFLSVYLPYDSAFVFVLDPEADAEPRIWVQAIYYGDDAWKLR